MGYKNIEKLSRKLVELEHDLEKATIRVELIGLCNVVTGRIEMTDGGRMGYGIQAESLDTPGRIITIHEEVKPCQRLITVFGIDKVVRDDILDIGDHGGN